MRTLALGFALLASLAACPGSGPSDAGAGDAAGLDGPVSFDAPPEAEAPGPLRLLAPLSTSRVGSPRPALRWRVPAGASAVTVEVCADRACAIVQHRATVSGPRYTVTEDLAPGAHFWRVSAGMDRTPVWEFFLTRASTRVATGAGTQLDVDGDGRVDLAVSTTHGNNERGRVFFYAGAGLASAQAPAVLQQDALGASHFGYALASAGDVDGDGYGELLVGAPDAMTGTGVAALYAGGARGLSATAVLLASPEAAAAAGRAVAGLGDTNGDGYGDVAVGAPSAAGSAGRVFVYLGGPQGLPARPSLALDAGDEAGAGFGAALASAGDVDGDGYGDLLAGAPGAAGGAGRAVLFLGRPSGFSAPIPLAPPDGASAAYGTLVANPGDLNGDGYSDFVVGAPSRGDGAVFVYYGGAQGPRTSPDLTLTAQDGPDGAYGTAATGGDLDGDGFDELVLSASCAVYSVDPIGGGPVCGDGFVYVHRGARAGLGSAPSPRLAGTAMAHSFFGYALSVPGDLDGDGLADLALTALRGGAMQGGSLLLFPGSASGVRASPARTIAGPDGPDGAFGWAVR